MAANETIGSVPCAFCGAKAPVRKNAKNKLYYVCPGNGDKACGIVQPNMPGFQEWILDHGTIDGPPKVGGIEKEKPAAPAAPAIEQKPPTERIPMQPTKAAQPVEKKPEPATQKKRGFGLIKF